MGHLTNQAVTEWPRIRVLFSVDSPRDCCARSPPTRALVLSANVTRSIRLSASGDSALDSGVH